MADADTCLPDGWIPSPSGRNLLHRDGAIIEASSDPSLWPRQINNFEFADGAQWSPEQIAALHCEAGAGPAKIKYIPLTLEYMPPSIDPARGRDISVSAMAWADWRRRVTGREVPKIEWSAPNDPASFDSVIAAGEAAAVEITGVYNLTDDGLYFNGEKISTELMPITLNMLNHADALGYDLHGEAYAEIYQVMAAHAPPPSNPAFGDILADMQRKLNETRAERDSALAEVHRMFADACEMNGEIARLNRATASLRAELRVAHDALGQRPAPAEPKPAAHNPFREFLGDRRRVGP